MVKKTQIDRLYQRIDLVAEQLGLAQRAEYVVWLDFGEPDEEFLARCLTREAQTADAEG